MYHLSSQRANLLRPLEPLLRGRVLEVGAGCGAITRFLGECGAHVVALEPSPRRAAIAASRCRDLPNVQVVCDRLETFGGPGSFDVVTLIGVLEYARVFNDATDSVQAMLESVRALLAGDGRLILAIENQLGLKYFAGYSEDHIGVPMFGIDDLYAERSAVTFGRVELQERLKRAGLHVHGLYFPLPDYKLPTSVVTPAGEIDVEWAECLASLASGATTADQQRPLLSLFSLDRAWRVVARNRLLPELANSFLFVAGRTEQSPAFDGSGLLAVHNGGARRPEFAKLTEFYRGAEGILVKRKLLDPRSKGVVHGIPLKLRVLEERFQRGEPWTATLTGVVNRRGWTRAPVLDWARTWLQVLEQEAGTRLSSVGSLVEGRFVDATPFNLLQSPDGGLHFVDLEWESEGSIEVGWLLFRGLFGSFTRFASMAEPDPSVQQRLVDLITTLSQELDLGIDPAALDRYCEAEARLQRWVSGSPSQPKADQFKQAMLSVRIPLSSAHGYRLHVEELERVVGARDAEIESQLSEVERQRHEGERLGGEVERLRKDLEHHNSTLLELSTLIVSRDRELDSLRGAVAERERELASSSAERAALQSKLEYGVERIAELTRARDALDRELDSLRGVVAERERELASSSAERAALQSKLEYGVERIAELVSLQQGQQREIEALRSRLDVGRDELVRATAELNGLGQLVADRDGRLTILTAEVGRLSKAVGRGEGQKAALTERLERAGERLEELAGELARTRAGLQDLATRLAQREGELAGQVVIAARLELELQALRPLPERLKEGEAREQLAADEIVALDRQARRLVAEAERRDGTLTRLNAELRDSLLEASKARLAEVREKDLAAPRVAERDREIRWLRYRLREHQAARFWRISSPIRDLLDLTRMVGELSQGTHRRVGGLLKAAVVLRRPMRRNAVKRIRASGIFDAAFYLRCHPDVVRGGLNPLVHYLACGVSEGWAPSPLFDPAFYVKGCTHPPIAGADPLLHYLDQPPGQHADPHPLFRVAYYLDRLGSPEHAAEDPLGTYLASQGEVRASPHPLFDPDFYLAANSHVAAEGIDPLFHYVERGWRDGLNPSPLFDVKYYLETNPHVKELGTEPVSHFCVSGWRDGLDPHPLFDTSFYLEANPDVVLAGRDPLQHFLEQGAYEARSPHPLFDTAYYLANNPGVATSGVNPLVHYLTTGAFEGRDPSPAFDSSAYLEAHPELARAGANPLVHFVKSGQATIVSTRWETASHAAVAKQVDPERGDPCSLILASGLFDAAFYLTQVSNFNGRGLDPLAHYVSQGWHEGLDPHPLFDTSYYPRDKPRRRGSGHEPSPPLRPHGRHRASFAPPSF